MGQAFRYFVKGIELRGETSDPSDNVEGSVFHNSSSQRLKTYIQGSIREIITSSQSQTLTNKTIDADNNTLSNIEVDNLKAGVLNTSTTLASASNTQIPSALAVKTYIDNKADAQNEASEISFAPVGTISATTVQAMGQELDSDIQAHINNTTAAHAASSISNTPSGNLAATDVQAALNELQTDIDTRATSSALSAHTGATSGVHGVTGSVVGTSDLQSLTNKTIDADLNTITNIENADIKVGAAIDASKVANGSVSNTEFQYLDGVTSSIQTQLNSKQGSITGAATTIVSSDLTASRAVVSDASGKVAASSVTSTELDHLTGVTSAIQTQLNGKEPTITTLPISKGGTNSTTALNNNRVMQSSGGAIVEAAAITASRALISDTNGIPTHSTVTSTTLAFLDATSSVQTQLNSKEPTITTLPISKGGTNSSTALNNNRIVQSSGGALVEAPAITASRALVSDTNGIPVASSVTSTELGFVSGVTSAIQTQLDGKVDEVGGTLTSGSVITPDRLDVKQGTKAELVSYAALPTTTNGQIVYAIDTKEMFQIVDGALVGIGGAGADVTFTIANNQSITNVTDLSFNGASVRGFVLDYTVYRQTATASSAVAQVGQLRGVFNTQSSSWFMTDDFSGQNSGVNFTITSAGQIQYTSTNIAGTSYVGTMKYTIRKTFGI